MFAVLAKWQLEFMQYIFLYDKLAKYHFPIRLEWVMDFNGVQCIVRDFFPL